MEISEVKVFPVSEEKLKAFVSVVFDGCFMVNDIKIICGREGLFISMPSRKKKNGEFKDVAHPLNNETRQMIEKQVLAEYERVLIEGGGVRRERGGVQTRRPPREDSGRRPGDTPSLTRPHQPPPPSQPPSVQPAPLTYAASSTRATEDGSLRSDSSGRVDLPSATTHRASMGHPASRAVPSAAPPARPQAPAIASSESGETSDGNDDTTLEEVEELHLRDSFWTVT